MTAALLSLHMLAQAQAQAQAPSPYWHDRSGKPLPETASTRSREGFAASLVITSDEDWKQKWDTPSDVTPHLTQADVVPYGKNIAILTFFSNPKPDAAGNVALRCDLKMLAPDGKVALEQADMNCYTGRIAGPLTNLYLSAPVINFAGDAGDPAGVWVVEVVLKDVVRGIALPLRSKFTLQ